MQGRCGAVFWWQMTASQQGNQHRVHCVRGHVVSVLQSLESPVRDSHVFLMLCEVGCRTPQWTS